MPVAREYSSGMILEPSKFWDGGGNYRLIPGA